MISFLPFTSFAHSLSRRCEVHRILRECRCIVKTNRICRDGGITSRDWQRRKVLGIAAERGALGARGEDATRVSDALAAYAHIHILLISILPLPR